MDIRCTNQALRGGPMYAGDEILQVPADGIMRDVSEKAGTFLLDLDGFEQLDAPAAPAKKAAKKPAAAKPKSKSKKTEDAPKKASVLSRMSRALSGEDEE